MRFPIIIIIIYYVRRLSCVLTILSGNHEFYRLQAGTEEEAVEWMRCIEASIQQDSVYDAFNQRKRRITSVQGLELPGFD